MTTIATHEHFSSRVMFGPIETNLGAGRALSDRHVAFYAARAAGGAGLIVTEIASVHESDWPYERGPLASECRPGWAEVADACRRSGALVLAGLGHAGGQGSSAYHRRELWAPSRVPDVGGGELPYAVEPAEIEQLVDGFASAASAAVTAGCAGVELNAGQHSILRQFLSGLTNRRTDEYGEDRTLLLRSVLASVRAAIGDRLLGLRLCCDELAPWAGITPEEALGWLPELAVDYLVPVRGSAFSPAGTRPDMSTPPGFNRELCARVRRAVRGRTAVVLQGSVVDVTMADAALGRAGGVVAGGLVAGGVVVADGSGIADLVEMTRAQLADPSLVALARAGRPERIRPCTLSNWHSAVRGPENLIISDDAEPATGYETTEPFGGAPAAPPRRALAEILVVGGGPAGLEAARSAALRGHRVLLVERGGELGGALRLAAALPGGERYGRLADWLVAEVHRLAVRVRLGAEIGVAELDAAVAAGQRVLLCTGSRPRPPGFGAGAGAGAGAGCGGVGAAVWPVAEFEAAVRSAGVLTAVRAAAASGVHVRVGGSMDAVAGVGAGVDLGAGAGAYVGADAGAGAGADVGAGADADADVVVGAGAGGGVGLGATAAVGAGAGVAVGSGAAVRVGVGPGDSVVLVNDPVGDSTGVRVAEQLAAAGLRVAVVTPDPVAGTQLGRIGELAATNGRLRRAGVAVEAFSRLVELADGVATLVDVHTGARRTLPCRLVVDCVARLPEDTLWTARPHLARAGDCVAPRTVYEAILEGRRWPRRGGPTAAESE